MRILVDSHVFVWAKCAPENLSDEARAALIDPANDVFVSVASAWELWIKHARKPMSELAPLLDSGASGFLGAARESGIEVLDITLEHVAAAAALPPVNRDPFDRVLVGQALTDRMTLMTSDPVLKRYEGVRLLDA
jgi:PIN domain nuclease of toxin-antitoxin system